MPIWLLQLAILFVILLAILWAAFFRSGESALAYCEPECPETVEYRAPPPMAPPPQPEKLISISGITVRCFILILIAGLAGFGIGRITEGPSATAVTGALAAATAARVAQGAIHGVAVAPTMLGALQTAATIASPAICWIFRPLAGRDTVCGAHPCFNRPIAIQFSR
jgi:hypothetical protein